MQVDFKGLKLDGNRFQVLVPEGDDLKLHHTLSNPAMIHDSMECMNTGATIVIADVSNRTAWKVESLQMDASYVNTQLTHVYTGIEPRFIVDFFASHRRFIDDIRSYNVPVHVERLEVHDLAKEFGSHVKALFGDHEHIQSRTDTIMRSGETDMAIAAIAYPGTDDFDLLSYQSIASMPDTFFRSVAIHGIRITDREGEKEHCFGHPDFHPTDKIVSWEINHHLSVSDFFNWLSGIAPDQFE